MNKLSVIRFGFFLLLSFVGLTVNAQDNVIDEVVWVVGDAMAEDVQVPDLSHLQ